MKVWHWFSRPEYALRYPPYALAKSLEVFERKAHNFIYFLCDRYAHPIVGTLSSFRKMMKN